MAQQSYLLFEINQSPCAIAADFVQEIFFLPALTDVAEAEADVAGILSLRGEILTVIDLNRRLGKPHRPFSLNHCVIVVNHQNQPLGMIVDRVEGVESIASETITSAAITGATRKVDCPVFLGLAQHQEQIIPLLNPEALLKGRSLSPEQVDYFYKLESNGSLNPPKSDRLPAEESPSRQFMAEFSPREQAVLRERAQNLRYAPDADSSIGLLPLAVVGLQGEYFGLNLERIHEFTDIHQITPIPCCPPHIVGNMNLRGEILTLVDISHLLQLKGDRYSDQNSSATTATHTQQAVVVRLDKLVAGVTVDTVHDVVYLHASEISAVPAAVHAMNEDFIRGVASYQDKQMSILDLSKILSSEDLVVNETV